ncbi:MAG: hypothetical protein OET44_02530 [Gammaproteobacteria bacterium]|nr:hypothetical protein [Gammaproteobacteria bacterium]
MTLRRARELICEQTSMGGGYNRNATRLILHEVHKEHGQSSVDRLLRALDLENVVGPKPGTDFSKVV